MKNWTVLHPFNSILYDDRFVQLLLVEIYDLEDLATIIINESVL